MSFKKSMILSPDLPYILLDTFDPLYLFLDTSDTATPQPIQTHLPIPIPLPGTATSTSTHVDRISNLPEPIIHRIMSLLQTKCATRTSALSRSWRLLWDSFPIFDFDQTMFFGKRELFMALINNSLPRLERSSKIDKFRLKALTMDPKIDMAIKKALERDIQDLDIEFFVHEEAIRKALERDIHEHDLEFFVHVEVFYNLPKSILCSTKSITSLKLKGFELRLEDLLSRCPSIEELVIRRCRGLKEVKFSSAKLKKLDLQGWIGLQNIQLCAPNLQSFSYLGFSSIRQCKIDLTSCKLIKKLTVSARVEDEQWLDDHISKLAHLENLVLHCCCMERVKIVHEKLKSLYLISSEDVVEVEVDCPKLCSVVYMGQIVHFSLLNSSGSLDATLALFRSCTNGWPFVEFCILLGMFDHCKKLKLVCSSYKDLIFPEEVKDRFLPPLDDLKHLKIECAECETQDYPNLVDSLLWLSPHLETLFVGEDKGA